jgi:putative photosynthetic complex assembly protein 2
VRAVDPSFIDFALPALFTVMAWWGSTALLFYLNNLPRATFRWSMLGATIVAAVSLHGLAINSARPSLTGAYLSFTCAVLAWGWLQMSFYMGFITGLRPAAREPVCTGWRHFGRAMMVGLYHELASIALAAAVIALTWDAPNQIGKWTFMILWSMHISAKLNVFLGVSNLHAEFLPAHLDFIRPFLTQKPMNLLFPLSISASTLVVVLLVQRLIAVATDPFQLAGCTFLATILLLAILEHWFLVLPLPAARSWNALWRWTLSARDKRLASLSGWHGVVPCRTSSSQLPTTHWRGK